MKVPSSIASHPRATTAHPQPLAGRAEASVEVAGIAGYTGDSHDFRSDIVVVEEPLEIRFAGYSVTVTMRTPGDDFDLAAGFLFTEGIIRGSADIASLRHCSADDPDSGENIVNVNPVDASIVDPSRWQRHFLATSSCGICGKASIAAVQEACQALIQEMPTHGDVVLTPYALFRFADELRRAQVTFHQTGGLHAASLFDVSDTSHPEYGRLTVAREDIGRHNAVDKVIGHALRRDLLPLHSSILVVSSRASFEIVQKAAMAGIPVVATVSAPSSMAINLARSLDITLIGFLRAGDPSAKAHPDRAKAHPDRSSQNPGHEGRFNVYAGQHRICTQRLDTRGYE